MKNTTRMTDRYITARLRRIEWMVKAGRIEKARAALNLLQLRGNAENCGMGERLYPWDKRIKAIEKSFLATWDSAEAGDTIGKPKGYTTEAKLPDYARARLQKKVREVFGKHTPGPWVAEMNQEDDGKYVLGIYSENRPGYVCGIHCAEGVTLDKEDEANARLIAAAPELLEACKMALETFERQFGRCSIGSNELRDAIAKAEGK